MNRIIKTADPKILKNKIKRLKAVHAKDQSTINHLNHTVERLDKNRRYIALNGINGHSKTNTLYFNVFVEKKRRNFLNKPYVDHSEEELTLWNLCGDDPTNCKFAFTKYELKTLPYKDMSSYDLISVDQSHHELKHALKDYGKTQLRKLNDMAFTHWF